MLAALPAEVVATDDDRQRIERDGQARLWWDDTPIDLFFDVHDFHRPGPFMADAPLQPLRPPMGWASGRQETKFL